MSSNDQGSWFVRWMRRRAMRRADEARARRVCAETLRVERERVVVDDDVIYAAPGQTLAIKAGSVVAFRGWLHPFASEGTFTVPHEKVAPPPWLGDGAT